MVLSQYLLIPSSIKYEYISKDNFITLCLITSSSIPVVFIVLDSDNHSIRNITPTIIDVTPTNMYPSFDLLINIGAASSKREAREFVLGNAISVNGEKVNNLEYIISDKDFLDDKYLIIRRGKKNYYIGMRG